jgi:hypothetical protein
MKALFFLLIGFSSSVMGQTILILQSPNPYRAVPHGTVTMTPQGTYYTLTGKGYSTTLGPNGMVTTLSPGVTPTQPVVVIGGSPRK